MEIILSMALQEGRPSDGYQSKSNEEIKRGGEMGP
ncbi:unnamed protein product, partial [Vitis vinifera]|uniref:Uncharacterized protein n=1 Tax=Vitis vinifera TaxID=29760 RepID=E0CT39_VITVI